MKNTPTACRQVSPPPNAHYLATHSHTETHIHLQTHACHCWQFNSTSGLLYIVFQSGQARHLFWPASQNTSIVITWRVRGRGQDGDIWEACWFVAWNNEYDKKDSMFSPSFFKTHHHIAMPLINGQLIIMWRDRQTLTEINWLLLSKQFPPCWPVALPSCVKWHYWLKGKLMKHHDVTFVKSQFLSVCSVVLLSEGKNTFQDESLFTNETSMHYPTF